MAGGVLPTRSSSARALRMSPLPIAHHSSAVHCAPRPLTSSLHPTYHPPTATPQHAYPWAYSQNNPKAVGAIALAGNFAPTVAALYLLVTGGLLDGTMSVMRQVVLFQMVLYRSVYSNMQYGPVSEGWRTAELKAMMWLVMAASLIAAYYLAAVAS